MIRSKKRGKQFFFDREMRGEKEKNMAYREILTELKHLEEKGVVLALEGRKAYPETIVQAHRVCEKKGAYSIMRDYVTDEKSGDIQEVNFNYVRNPRW